MLHSTGTQKRRCRQNWKERRQERQLHEKREAGSGSAGAKSKTMKEPSVLLSHPTGNQNVRNALRSLAENGMLAEFWTTVAWDSSSRWNQLLPQGLRAQLGRRSFPEVSKEKIRSVAWREMVRLAARPLMLKGLFSSRERPFSVIGVYRHFDSKVSSHLELVRPDAVYAYEGGALQTFRKAKELGIRTLHEQPSSYWHWVRKLLKEEAELTPEFSELLPNLMDSRGHLEWKDEELRLADFVFVPSEHVRLTLAGVVPDEKIRVVTYGAPKVRPRKPPESRQSGPLNVLFVGALAQHKGISYLLDAVDGLGAQVSLTLVGRRFRPNARVDEACGRWRWFDSLPHIEVMNLMQESDVLVLPSLTEGCALVVLEALACGLPVIVTPNTGSLEFVSDRREGYVVPIRRADLIAERLAALCRDRELLAAMSRNAQIAAAKNSWETYRARWADAVRALCD